MRGKDGRGIESEVGADLDYLSQLSRRLGVADLVEEYFTPVVGDWNDLHDEAERWRAAGQAAESVTEDLLKPLGRLDSAWQGASADSFVDHMRQVGLAGHDMSDVMVAMGEALDETAEGIRGIVQDMAEVFRDTADTVSGAAGLPLDGDARIVAHLDDLKDPAREMYESVRDVLEAFGRLCDGLSGEDPEFAGPTVEHAYPERNWQFAEAGSAAGGSRAGQAGQAAQNEQTGQSSQAVRSMSGSLLDTGSPAAGKPEAPAAVAGAVGGATGSVGGGSVAGGVPGGSVGGSAGSVGSVPAAPAAPTQPTQPGGYTAVQEPRTVEQAARPVAAAAAGGGGAQGGQAAGGGMMAPMGGAGGQQGGDKEHKSKVRLAGSTEEVFGKPGKTAPPVVGE
ncbi:hypothetical protein [Umezawaea sp. Da 62-37]|uniref:WXG100 family type VII secretion target n=1 Tax=Umezawaea sp. Da 62-37 TaxID=3075927 RepID=UPI0028F6C259|nr:hypothetical protein [Umezawaea sp. Da 62-37]WNV90859.1 hypothetical protein RM788_22040 [Umezawaea sp. Da 62-37]